MLPTRSPRCVLGWLKPGIRIADRGFREALPLFWDVSSGASGAILPGTAAPGRAKNKGGLVIFAPVYVDLLPYPKSDRLLTLDAARYRVALPKLLTTL
jgi:hypothetical protein